MVTFLLALPGIDITITDNNGKTAKQLATDLGFSALVDAIQTAENAPPAGATQ